MKPHSEREQVPQTRPSVMSSVLVRRERRWRLRAPQSLGRRSPRCFSKQPFTSLIRTHSLCFLGAVSECAGSVHQRSLSVFEPTAQRQEGPWADLTTRGAESRGAEGLALGSPFSIPLCPWSISMSRVPMMGLVCAEGILNGGVFPTCPQHEAHETHPRLSGQTVVVRAEARPDSGWEKSLLRSLRESASSLSFRNSFP